MYRIMLVLIIMCFSAGSLSAGEVMPPRGNVVVFTVPHRSIQMRALLDKSAGMINDVFFRGGRFLPVESNRVISALKEIQPDGKEDYFKKVARFLNVDVYAVISVVMHGKITYARMKIIPLNKHYSGLDRVINVRSRILTLIPHKLARETVLVQRKTKLRIKIVKAVEDGFLIEGGQWHGLKQGAYTSADGRNVIIMQTYRYRSLAQVSGQCGPGDVIVFERYPEMTRMLERIENDIETNIEYRYGLGHTLLKGNDPEKRFIEAVCIISTGANICLPGYGSHLSVEYMGIPVKSPSTPGIVMSASMVLTQFTLTEFLTGFKSNFAPWVVDGDKTQRMADLQAYLWSTLPLTFSASYLDQLAYQFARTKHLPPFFLDRDSAALGISLFVPGGGLFYKGHRITGWGYYLTEMFLGGYGIYNLGRGKKSIYAFSALGAVKLAELIHAFVIGPSYDFFLFEKEGAIRGTSLFMGTGEHGHENIYSLAVSLKF